jgi:hypothetical protein
LSEIKIIKLNDVGSGYFHPANKEPQKASPLVGLFHLYTSFLTNNIMKSIINPYYYGLWYAFRTTYRFPKLEVHMKSTKFLPLFLLLAVILAACSAQPTTISSLIGTTAPDFQLDNTSGGQTKLSDFQGSPVLLFFHMAVG